MKKFLLFLLVVFSVFALFSCDGNIEESKNDFNKNVLKIKFDDKVFEATYNLEDDIGDVAIYDREYVINGGLITLNESHNNRKVYRVTVDAENVFTVKESVSANEAIIPMNGFLISFADTSINLNYNTLLTVENYNFLKFETGEYCSFSVGGERRRVYLKNPTNDNFDEDIIVFLTSDYPKEYTLKENEVAYSIVRDKIGIYYVGEKLSGSIPKDTYALIFTGKYNIAFAEKFMVNNEKVNFRSLNSANGDTYNPSVKIEDKIYTLMDNNVDQEGIYLFDCSYEKFATPKFKSDFICTVVNDDKISFIGEVNQQLVVPNKNGYLLCFVGNEYISLAKDNQKIKPLLIDPISNKESEVSLEYFSFSKALDGVNKTREANNLIVYTPSYGNTTKTNEWGCEIAVDKNGLMVEISSTGSMVIPEGGFVISGHGDMIDWIKENYLYGAEVKFDNSKKTITVSVTPLTTVSSVVKSYEIVKFNYDEALKSYRDFDVETLDKLLAEAESYIDKTNDEDLSNIIEAVFLADKAIKKASNMYFSSSTVENRAVWYAPTERSEAEVKKTIELIKSLNINALYIETWRSGQTNYKTNLDLVLHESTYAGFDVLEAFVRLGHENGIEIHAWVHDFFVGTDYHKGVKGHVLNKHPEWALKTRSGSVLNPTEYGNFMFLNPYKRECRDLVLSVYREIIENYDVDGLHLDYIRFPEPNSTNEDWGYNDDIMAAFQAEYNTNIDPRQINSGHSMWNAWCKFRENIITSFVGEVYDLVQEVNPDIWLSAAIYPNMKTTPKTIFQNFVPWVENGWMDEIFAMAYASSADTVIDISSNFLNAIKGKCFYSAGIGAFAQYDDIAYLEQIEQLRNTKAVGSNIFSLASVNGNNLMKLLQETVYRNDTVQVYDPKCVSAYLQSMIDRCDGVYTKSDLSENDLNDLRDILSTALDEVNKIQLSDSSRASKKVYFESVRPIIDSIDVMDFDSKDSTLYTAVEAQIYNLLRIIDTNITIFS